MILFLQCKEIKHTKREKQSGKDARILYYLSIYLFRSSLDFEVMKEYRVEMEINTLTAFLNPQGTKLIYWGSISNSVHFCLAFITRIRIAKCALFQRVKNLYVNNNKINGYSWDLEHSMNFLKFWQQTPNLFTLSPQRKYSLYIGLCLLPLCCCNSLVFISELLRTQLLRLWTRTTTAPCSCTTRSTTTPSRTSTLQPYAWIHRLGIRVDTQGARQTNIFIFRSIFLSIPL